MSIELPPQQWICVAPTPDGRLISLASEESVEPRERILMARIAELEAEVHAHTEAIKVFEAANAELQADAERRNMLRNSDRTRSRCYHYVVSLGELGVSGNKEAAAAFMATAKEMRLPHVGRKQIKRIALEASCGAFGHSDDPYADAEAIDAARKA